MELETASKLVEFAQDLGYDFTLEENYSGRFMYGKQTAGIIVDGGPTFTQFIYQAADLIAEAQQEGDLPMELGSLRIDNMGWDYILY